MAPILEGVFAINKPPAISSAQVIRDVQSHFTPSALFAPWVQREKDKLDAESHNQKNKRRSWKQRQKQQVKIGHGGTLDPLATGVLILGVGSGTKSLASFLQCTKSYETAVLFGAATDSYDTEGKIVARKPYNHVTREMVEKALGRFRGDIMQRPPIFSALRVQGKRLYEYARSGEEVPVEIKERPVTVESLELLEWMEGGSHEWKWPETEAGREEKVVAEKVLHLGKHAEEDGADIKAKRKREEVEETVNGAVTDAQDAPSLKRRKSSPEPVVSGALPNDSTSEKSVKVEPSSPDPTASASEPKPCPAPAVRVRMTVTSGFYVRSLAHDLGAAVGSLGIMASLVRTRQGEFELGKNVLQYDDLAGGEEMWGSEVKKMLEDWQQKRSGEGDGEKGGTVQEDSEADNAEPQPRQRKQQSKLAARDRVRRNTSSEED